ARLPSPDPPQIRPLSLHDALPILLVLDDYETAGAGVVQQPSVARDQRGLGLVRPAADHNRVVPGKIATRERVGTEQLDRHAHRLDRKSTRLDSSPDWTSHAFLCST